MTRFEQFASFECSVINRAFSILSGCKLTDDERGVLNGMIRELEESKKIRCREFSELKE